MNEVSLSDQQFGVSDRLGVEIDRHDTISVVTRQGGEGHDPTGPQGSTDPTLSSPHRDESRKRMDRSEPPRRPERLPIHYPNSIERSADRWVHAIGLSAAALGGATLLAISLSRGHFRQAAAIGVYAACLVVMLLASTLYNLAGPRRRPLLRRFDHAAIFLMIAGSYTPFTLERLSGGWSLGMTAAVWTVALAGAGGKILLPGLAKGLWVALYLALGWIAVAAIKPLIASVSLPALILLLAGGLVYSAGVVIYLTRALPFRRAIWHGFVVAAAAIQYTAILIGVVLPAGAGAA
jgi:hemolysin III